MFGLDMYFIAAVLAAFVLGAIANAGARRMVDNDREVLAVEIKQGNRGRWRWYVKDPRTLRTLGQCPVRGYPSPEAAEGVLRRVQGARIAVTVIR